MKKLIKRFKFGGFCKI